MTREYVERFLEQWTNPLVTIIHQVDHDTGEVMSVRKTASPSIADALYGGTPSPQEPLYVNGMRDSTKCYIGRAARVTDGKNPHETLWAVKTDIAHACRQLPKLQRIILGLRYVLDYHDETIADYVGISKIAVSWNVNDALERIAKILDRK